MKTKVALKVLALLSMLNMAPAHAVWPDAPIRVVVPYPAGAAGDLAIRQMLPRLQARLGQPIVVDNKAGAGGNIGTLEVVRAKPDGYTLLLGATNNFVINQYIYKTIDFDPLQALMPITKLVDVPSVLFVNSSVPAVTFKEFAAYAKSNVGKLNFGSPGSGTAPHLSGYALSNAIGAEMTHIPYKGAQPGVTGLLGNEVQMFLVGYSVAGPQIPTGRLRALTVFSPTRLKALPGTPTAQEAGAPNVVLSNWWGLAAPKGTDLAIIKRLADEVKTVLGEPSMQQYLSLQGFVAGGESSADFSRQLNQEAAVWQDIVKKSGARVD